MFGSVQARQALCCLYTRTGVYNLIVTAEENAWDESPYSMSLDRLGEHTAEALKARFRTLSDKAIAELISFPTLFAYEQQNGQPARLGRVTRVARPSGKDVRFQFKLLE